MLEHEDLAQRIKMCVFSELIQSIEHGYFQLLESLLSN